MKTKQQIRWDKKKKRTREMYATLKATYSVSMHPADPTAIQVKNITEKQHVELCKKLKCSGHYSESSKTECLLNFGEFD